MLITAANIEENVIRFGRDEWLAMQARKRQAKPAPSVTYDPSAGWKLLFRATGFVFFDEAARFCETTGAHGLARFYGHLANQMLED